MIGVIGYRVYHAGESGAASIANGTVLLPKGAHVVSTTIGDGHIVVTLDIGGASEVRIYDLKTLQQTGRLRFGDGTVRPVIPGRREAASPESIATDGADQISGKFPSRSAIMDSGLAALRRPRNDGRRLHGRLIAAISRQGSLRLAV